MFKSILGVVAAAMCAATIVAFVPEPEPATAATTPQGDQHGIQAGLPIAAAPLADAGGATCTQTWPYYERSCLRDSRRPNGEARTARVIPTDHPAKVRASRAR